MIVAISFGLLRIGAARLVGAALCVAAQRIGVSALVHQRRRRDLPAVADLAHQDSGATSASVKKTWLNEAWPFIWRSG